MIRKEIDRVRATQQTIKAIDASAVNEVDLFIMSLAELSAMSVGLGRIAQRAFSE